MRRGCRPAATAPDSQSRLPARRRISRRRLPPMPRAEPMVETSPLPIVVNVINYCCGVSCLRHQAASCRVARGMRSGASSCHASRGQSTLESDAVEIGERLRNLTDGIRRFIFDDVISDTRLTCRAHNLSPVDRALSEHGKVFRAELAELPSDSGGRDILD